MGDNVTNLKDQIKSFKKLFRKEKFDPQKFERLNAGQSSCSAEDMQNLRKQFWGNNKKSMYFDMQDRYKSDNEDLTYKKEKKAPRSNSDNYKLAAFK